MDSNSKLEEIELLDKAWEDCQNLKKWLACSLSKVEALNKEFNVETETDTNINNTRKDKKSKKNKSKNNKRSKAKIDIGSKISESNLASSFVEKNNDIKTDLLVTRLESDDTSSDIASSEQLELKARNSQECLTGYAKINKRFIEVKRSVESLMVDMQRVDNKLKHRKDEFHTGTTGFGKSGCCCCHHH